MAELVCTFHPPKLESWLYVVACHGAYCVGGGVPIGLWAYYVGRRRPRCCVGLAMVVALSIPLYLHHSYRGSSSGEAIDPLPSPVVWVGHFLGSTFGFSTAFKLWNVAYQQFPEGADASLQIFLAWFLILPEPQFVKGKTRTLSRDEIQEHLSGVLYKIVGIFVLLSMLTTPATTTREVVAGSETNSDTAKAQNGGWSSILAWILQILPTKGDSLVEEAWNGWLHLWWLYTWVSFWLEASVLVTMPITGFQAMEPAFRNPLLESRSFQEVWGTRWNLPIQALLQRTAYVPLRKQGYSRTIAAVGTFVVSGILHEYNFWTHNFAAYRQPGIATLFFVAMGFLMLVESKIWAMLVPAPLRALIQKHVPSFLVSFGLIMLSAIPVERYFIKSWLEAGMIEASSQLFPHVTCR